MKKQKIPYDDQKAVWDKASSFLRELVSRYKCVREAYVWASLAEGSFGTYEQEYRGQDCSDIDLVIIVDEDKPLPKEWKFTTVEKAWFDLYKLGFFEYNGNKHPIDGLIVKPSKHDIDKMHRRLKGRSRKIYERPEF